MLNQDDIDDLNMKAEQYINAAENFIMQDKIIAGIKQYQKALNIYIKLGSFLKLPEIFNRVSELLQKESTIYEVLEYLKSIKFRLEKLDVPEIEAQIQMMMGNLLFKIGDYESAAEYFEDCAELYLKADPEEFKTVNAMLLIRAAECYEFLKKHEKGERILIQALIRLNPRVYDFQAEEYKAYNLVKKGDYQPAIEIFEKIIEYIEKTLEYLSEAVKSSALEKIAIKTKMRLIHFISEFRLILGLIYNELGQKEALKKIALEAVQQLDTSIEMAKGLILRNIWTRIDLKQITYDAFMMAYFTKLSGIEYDFNGFTRIDEFILDGLSDEIQEQTKKLPYFELIIHTYTYSLSDVEEELFKFNLGRLEKYKHIFMKKQE